MTHREKVIRSRELHQLRQQKIYTATLLIRAAGGTTTNQAYAYCYVNPISEDTGLASGGTPNYSANIELFQEGETYAPRVDDAITVNGVTYRINSVRTRLNADTGYAIHDLTAAAVS